jgi:hypothetical protein
VIAGGTKDYVLVNTVVAFTNPSQITISVGDINFSAKTTDGTYTVGQVFIKDTIIKPGVNQYNAEFHLAGPSAVIGHLFTNYLTNVQMPLSIVGTPESTAIEPLKKALGSVKLATTMNGIQANLIVSVKVIIKVDELLAGRSTSVATLKNPFETPYVLNGLKADVYFPSTISGTFKVGHVDSIPGPCTIPAGGTASCDPWTVIMDAGLDKLIEILVADEKVLNMQQNISCLVGGSDGYSSEFYYAQDRVPTEVEFDAGLFAIPLSPKVNTTESANTTSTTSTSVPVSSSSSTTDKPTEAPITTTTTQEQSTETPTKSSEATAKATTESKSEPTASAAVKDSHFIFPF